MVHFAGSLAGRRYVRGGRKSNDRRRAQLKCGLQGARGNLLRQEQLPPAAHISATTLAGNKYSASGAKAVVTVSKNINDDVS